MSAAEFKDIGNKHLQAKEFDQAIEAYTKAIEIEPSNHVFYSNRSAAYLSKGDSTNALADGLKCTEVNPSWPKGYSRHGAALHALKKYDDAQKVYKKGLEVAPTDAGLLSGLEEVKKAQAAANAPASNPLGGLFSPQAMEKLRGNPKFAAKFQNPQFVAKLQMMQSNPQMMMSDPEMMEVLQALLGDMGAGAGMPPPRGANDDDDDAEDVPSKFSSTPASTYQQTKPAEKKPPAPAMDPTSVKGRAEAAKTRGNDLYKAKKFDEALAAYDEAISIDPSNILYNNNKAAVMIEKGDCDGAIALCNDALDKARESKASFEVMAKVHQRIAAAHLKKLDYDEAIKAYERAQMETFDKAVASKIKNLELERKKRAIAAYIDPVKGVEAKERGNDFFRAGDFPSAIKEYEEAVKRDPTNAAYYNNLAAALVKIMDFNGAKAAVEKSLERDPKYVKAWAKKGDIEFFMKEYHKAIESYQKGLSLEPTNSACKQGLEKTQRSVQAANYGSEADPDRAARAMADPAIQAILQDPVIRQVLTDFQENPSHAQRAMNDPNVRAKMDKLIQAGVLKVQ
jgi:stress-induced-phosphoprotein 1